jgi:hypothetical protein
MPLIMEEVSRIIAAASDLICFKAVDEGVKPAIGAENLVFTSL